jgi:hypothetical protein
LLSFRSAAEESGFVLAVAFAVAVAVAFAVAVAVASSCRHPERSEGPRRTSLTPTARTFPTHTFNARFPFFSPQRQKSTQTTKSFS